MDNEKLLSLIKKVDPTAVRVPLGISEIADAIIAYEREECARLCEQAWHSAGATPIHCAHAIRAR